MWIFTNKGFISVVEDKNDANRLMVRARAKGHIEAIFPGAKPIANEGTDYKYRVFLPREQVIKALVEEFKDIDYSNFKDSILLSNSEGRKYHDACVDVWDVMRTAYED